MGTEDEHPSGDTITLALSESCGARLPDHPALTRPVGPSERRRQTLAGHALPVRHGAPRAPASPQPNGPIPDAPSQGFMAELKTTGFVLRPAPGTTVAATLRIGTLQAGLAAEPVCRLELTAREGDPAAPWQLALALHRAEPLRLDAESLAARGLRLVAGTPAPPRHASDPGLHPRTRLGEGLARIVLAGVTQMLANEPAVLGSQVEGVHQMRVAVRQLRAGLRLFAPLLPEDAPTDFDARLRTLGRVLGEARDWDVFCTETLPALAAASHGEPATEASLAVAATAWREQAHEALSAELASPQPTALGLELGGWALGRAQSDSRLAEHAAALLHPLARKLRRRGHHLRRLSPEGLHDLRKALKTLRYATDFLGPLFPGPAVHRYVRRCKALQAVLGDINDAAMTAQLAGRLGDAEGLHGLLAWTERRRRHAIPSLGRAWERMREAEPYWA